MIWILIHIRLFNSPAQIEEMVKTDDHTKNIVGNSILLYDKYSSVI